jgi:hypothetical protein
MVCMSGAGGILVLKKTDPVLIKGILGASRILRMAQAAWGGNVVGILISNRRWRGALASDCRRSNT